jgi:putative pyruvate formate lyase activating enzyme
VQENLLWAAQDGELIVRHLLMPGHFDCCWKPVAEWLAAELPSTKINLRSGFWPAWQTARHDDLCQMISSQENAEAFQLARDLNLNLIS